MKKSGIAVAVIVLAGGVYVANNILVEKAANELVSYVEHLAHETSSSAHADVQVLGSTVNGNQIEQELAIYVIDNGKRIENPIYITHSAQVGLFGFSVDGKLILAKDKGLAAMFISEVTSFNENINYTLRPTTHSIDLSSKLNIGVIQGKHKETTKIGEMAMAVSGTVEDSVMTFTVDGLNIHDYNGNMFNFGKLTIDQVTTAENHTLDITLSNGSILDPSGSLHFKDIKLLTSTGVGDMSAINYDWTIGSVDVNSATLTLDDFKMGLKGRLEGFDSNKLMDYSNLVSSHRLDEADALFAEILGDGFKFSNIDFYVNDSSIKGGVVLTQRNYQGLPQRQITEAIADAMSVDLDVTLTPQVISRAGIPPKVTNQLMTMDEKNNYHSKIIIANGKVTANGVSLN
ncbi:hypothetical protein [Vibrio ezurae]|uniref:DUF945 domain-containing protein n=1 Tax=Vibrio ezurae NBRC 102218 TaxID=1219080 RepID=U3AMY4_9VIBR|nr:hypothetical protein [Vibrio ezurae]GAD81271.1 hypothetical protein VEZ01S_54_00220 [Vibrio ezurae NBRC 102218]